MHVRRAVGGDARSLGWVVARLSPLLQAQADYRLGPTLRTQVDPEDLVHGAWVVALPRIAELSEREGRITPVLLKFLTTTMTYRINRLLRHRLKGSTGAPSEDGEGRHDPLSQLPSDASGAITQAVRHERQEQVQECLDQLEPRDRDVLILRGIEQHPAKTVAVMLELTPAAVDQRYSRALKKLRGRLPDSVFDELD